MRSRRAVKLSDTLNFASLLPHACALGVAAGESALVLAKRTHALQDL